MRLLLSPPQDGITNMATDQAIMEAVGSHKAPPTLRFYAWEPGCLSLGYAQRSGEVDSERLRKHQWNLVRRPTGGRAILHINEFTYSISLPQNHALVEGDILTSYLRLSQALQAALEHLGIKNEAKRRTGRADPGPICFEIPSHYEITVAGRKLIGSAQVRRHQAVLQHGSMPLHGDITRICDVLVFPDETARESARRGVEERATTIEATLGYRVSWDEIAQAVQNGFRDVFGIVFENEALTPDEISRIAVLRREIYGNASWTYKR